MTSSPRALYAVLCIKAAAGFAIGFISWVGIATFGWVVYPVIIAKECWDGDKWPWEIGL